MIDTDKYENHSTGWKHKINHSTYSIINDDGQKVASVPCYEECNIDSQLIADAPLLLAEVKRLRAYKEFADGVDEWSSGAAFIHHLATAVQGIRLTGELDEDAFNKGCQEYYNGENSIAQVSTIQWNNLEEEVKRLREEVYNLTRANDTAWALLEVAGEEE